MRVPVRWLKEYVDTDLSAEEIAHCLTMAGLEAENIVHVGAEWDKVYVGRVEKIAQHPDADRLVLATVVAGEHQLTVVTGAPNIREGQVVPLALVGARLVDGHSAEYRMATLKASLIRGVRSEGMVCSEKELGLSDEHEGIMVLDPKAPVGVPLREYLGDDVIEFEITPNLAHAFSVIGIARELAAILNLPVHPVPLADLSTVAREPARVQIEAPDLCGRYALAIIDNMRVGPSPEWMQRRLTLAGMRPVNNLVDITNYVMAEVGQPLHAFDASELLEERIVVRRARAGERIETLDHVERDLDDEMLVIADAERPRAVAGVMGGVASEVTDSTTRIVLEAAGFDSRGVRRTTRMLKLNSEASARFQRGVDPNLAWVGLQRFIELLKDVVPEADVQVVADAYPQPRERTTVEMPYAEVERLLGMSIPLDEVVAILARLDLQPRVEVRHGATVIVTSPPTYRMDISQAADLVEEVIRIYGYESLPESLPTGQTVSVRRDPERLTDIAVQDALVAAGLQQVITYSMISEADLIALSPTNDALPAMLGAYDAPEENFVRAVNPLRSDWELMRPTMLPSLLKIVAENRKHSDHVAIYETARTYQPRGLGQLPDERRGVAIAMCGVRAPLSWHASTETELDFFDVKGVIERLLQRLGASEVRWQAASHPSLHPGRSAVMMLGDTRLGVMGEVHPAVAAHFGIEGRVAVAELDLAPLVETFGANWSVTPVSRFQATRQDFAVVVREDVAASAVQQAITDAAFPFVADVALFDIYRGTGIPEGYKSLAYRLALMAPDRQLAEREIERIRTKIEQNLKKRVGGTLRA